MGKSMPREWYLIAWVLLYHTHLLLVACGFVLAIFIKPKLGGEISSRVG
jgi:hypothetical protein